MPLQITPLHDLDVGRALVGPQMFEHGVAIHAGHADIEQDEIRGRLAQRAAQAAQAVWGERQVVVVSRDFDQQAAVRPLVPAAWTAWPLPPRGLAIRVSPAEPTSLSR